MYETLIYLVGIHAQVSSVTLEGGLLERVLGYLVVKIADEALSCFRQVKRFGMSGMLRVCLLLSLPLSISPSIVSKQATLEIEFMHQTLGRYAQPASATLEELYNRISQSYARRPGDESLQGNLDGVKKTLADTRRATGIEFLCFRQTKTSSSGSTKVKRDKSVPRAR